MDRTEIARSWYDRGVRAYERDGKPITQTQEKIVLDIMSVSALACWYELRRIQDAERKKGTPISPKECNPMRSDYKLSDVTFQFYPCPDYPNDPPQVNLFTPGTVWAHGKFTNFRWRAGYPKGGNCE